MNRQSKRIRTSASASTSLQAQDGVDKEQNSNNLLLFIYQGRRVVAPRHDCYEVSAWIPRAELNSDSPSTSPQSRPAETSSRTYLHTTPYRFIPKISTYVMVKWHRSLLRIGKISFLTSSL